MIELRAGQAKTASRRIVPITRQSRRLAGTVDRDGPVVPEKRRSPPSDQRTREEGGHHVAEQRAAAFLHQLPDRQDQDAEQVALEAGNSPAIIFKHYRELVTEEAAEKWFGIMPPEDWDPPVRKRRRRRKKKGQ